jgi:hypothetical protein
VKEGLVGAVSPDRFKVKQLSAAGRSSQSSPRRIGKSSSASARVEAPYRWALKTG